MTITLHNADCLTVMRGMDDNSVDLIATDPPYFRVKGEAWDRQWSDADAFIAWIGELCEQWQRILKPNGSLYVFASPQMRARVEIEVGRWFNCLPTVTWVKGAGWHAKAKPDDLRSYFPRTEAIIFAEHFSADNMAKGEAGYVAKCDELRGFVFEPLRAYLAGERDRAGWTTRRVAEAFQRRTGSRTVTGMAGHWFERVQWTLPTEANYLWLRELFNGERRYLCERCGGTGKCDHMTHGGVDNHEDGRCGLCGGDGKLGYVMDHLRREYEDLRREYEDLRREYEDLRRPFTVTADVPYTDVWTFPTVPAYKGKHVCEKPLAMMEHIVKASSRPDGVVLDCFMGSGVTGEAAVSLGRSFIGIEMDEKWHRRAADRIHNTA